MNRIKLITVGKIKEEFYRNKIEQYKKELQKKCQFELVELPDESIPQKASQTVMDKIKEIEGKKILEQINSRDYVVALCIDGTMLDNERFAKLSNKAEMQGKENVTFVIGGSLGLSEQVVGRADYKLSFSAMTFPHQLMRVMLMELLVISDIV